MKYENILKEQKAITLIALVITIVVMLILAGVTINLTLGENGIFTTAQQAAKNYTKAEEQEFLDLQNFEEQMNQYIETSSHSGVVHYDAIYKVASYNTETSEYTYTELKPGEKFPDTVSNGDVYIYGDYEYRYNQYYEYDTSTWVDNTEQNGWGVTVLDRTKTSYGEILTSINGKNITSLYKTFRFCKQLIEAPAIPSGVTNMYYTFGGCHKLVKGSTVPGKVENMEYAYAYCTNLHEIPTIYDGVKNMRGSFRNCTTIKQVTDLPDSVEILETTFYQCTSLVSVSGIPDTITNMRNAFFDCTALTTIDNIPSNLTNLERTFMRCTNLSNVPAIPKDVTNMQATFFKCTSLTNTIEINANPTTYENCFGDVDFVAQGLSLTGDSDMLDELGATGLNYSSDV